MLEFLRQQLEALRQKRAALKTELDGVVNAAKTEKRGLNDDERTKLTAGNAELRKFGEEEDDLLKQISDAEDVEKREQAAADARAKSGQTGQRTQGGARVTSEPMTYQRGGGQSYFLDLGKAQLRGDGEALARLHRHGREMDVEMPRREQVRAERARRALDGIEGADRWTDEQRASIFESRVAPNTTDGQGGYFVPPLWLVDQNINILRFGRVTANLCENFPLPGGTDSINIPRVTTGTKTGITPEASAVPSQDLTDDFVTAKVRTIAGQEDTSMQVLDQSPVGFDQVIFRDLIEDYNMRLDLQVIDGTGVGEHLGILNVSGVNAITYTDASPTLPELYVPIAQGASKVFTGRKLPATGAIMYPPQWYWATSQTDTTNRPLIVPPTVAFNPMGTQQQLATEDGPAGMLSIGVPAYLDGNMPATKGTGANETRIIEARFSDLYLWEGALRTRVLQEVLSGTLQVRFQVYAYSAFMPHRRPTSISVISGTGMIPAAGF